MPKVNVYESFTQALFFSGSVSIPKYLLKHYADLDLTNQEMMLIIHILSEIENNPCPPTHLLGERMHITNIEVEEIIAKLTKKNYLALDKRWDASTRKWYKSYSITGLIDELVERWAIDQVKQYEVEKALNDTVPTVDIVLGRLVKIFEQEIGRPLTELECQYINNWLSAHVSEELIIEALRRGVGAGIRNFRYLDSILREWEKKGLRTIVEIEADDANFQSRQEKQVKGKRSSTRKTTSDKYENFYL